jgi:hypothetical protein
MNIKPLLIYAGKPRARNQTRQLEVKEYYKGVDVIFNWKAYCTSKEFLDWLRSQYNWGSPYSPDDHEPRLLVLDSFAPHKNQGTKQPAKKRSEKAESKYIAEEQVRQQLREELKKLNTITSIIPGGCTAYLQPLDIFINKIIKNLIRDAEEQHYDDNIEEWKAGKYTKRDRRILLTHWVGQAWEVLHRDYKETIIKTFRQTGLLLNPDGTKDSEIKIRDIPHVKVGD